MVAAELPIPQSMAEAMWPPHERTTVDDEAVKYTVVNLLLSPV